MEVAFDGAYRLMRWSPGEHAGNPVKTRTITIRVQRLPLATSTNTAARATWFAPVRSRDASCHHRTARQAR